MRTLAGAAIGLLLAIAYDTSAQTSVLEGGQRHLPFNVVLIIAAAGAAVGLASSWRRR